MQVYLQEIIDGLESAIAGQKSVAYTALAEPTIALDDVNIQELIDQDNLAVANNLDQIDLFYMRSILVSTGWNLNDDIFLPEYTWAARKTPEDKQFNFMHNEKDIIGHITSNQVADLNGNILPDDLQEPPEEFNIITNAVIYTHWTDLEQHERINQLVAEIKEGKKWFVSMECIFSDFDYALRNTSGEVRIVSRDNSTAHLSRSLRAYGGSGMYGDYKVGRVLKNMTFSGKGLVDKPANPKSVILPEESIAKIKQETDMASEPNTQELEQVKSQLVDAKAELLQAKSTIADLEKVQAQVEDLQSQIASLNETIASLTSEKEGVVAAAEELKSQLNESVQANEELSKQVAEFKQAAKTQARKSMLVEAGLAADKVDSTLAKFDSIDDEAFSAMVSLMSEGMKKEKSKKDEEKDEESYSEVLDDAEQTSEAEVTETEEESAVANLHGEMTDFFRKSFAATRSK